MNGSEYCMCLCIRVYVHTDIPTCTHVCVCVNVCVHGCTHRGSSEILRPAVPKGKLQVWNQTSGRKRELPQALLPPSMPPTESSHTDHLSTHTFALSPSLLVLSANMSTLWPQDAYPGRMSSRPKNIPPTALPRKHRPPGAHS